MFLHLLFGQHQPLFPKRVRERVRERLLFEGFLPLGQGVPLLLRVPHGLDRRAFPATRPYGPENLSATILHHLFDLSELRLMDGLPSEILAMSNDSPIEELF